MLRFLIGVDKRTYLGADIERILSTFYDIAEFEVVGAHGTLPCKSLGSIEKQVDLILEKLYGSPARYFIAVSRGVVDFTSLCGPVPTPITVVSAVDADGIVYVDHTKQIGYHKPWCQRSQVRSHPRYGI